MTIRLPDSKHERLRLLAQVQGVSLNKLVEEWAGMALAQFDAEATFQARAARGNAKRGLALLSKLDGRFVKRGCRQGAKTLKGHKGVTLIYDNSPQQT